jgi:hypothetical protein
MKRIATLFLIGVLAVGLAAAALAAAGPYSLDWWTVGGGGGTSDSASYTLAGTIGQPEVGEVMSSGTYTVAGGFWGVGAPPREAFSVYLPVTLKGH